MVRKMSRRIAIVLAMAMLLTCFACVASVSATDKADLQKVNVKWDLKNNKTLKYKSAWTAIGVKQHTVKMTKYKVTKAATEGYNQCSFTLTFNRKISANKNQVRKMAIKAESIDTFGGDMYFTVVDYATGKSLEAENNDKGVIVKSDWKYTKWKKINGKNKSWIRYARKTKVNVTIIYPENYHDLVIGTGGYPTVFDRYKLEPYWEGQKALSAEKRLFSKKDKKYAHFMRVK